MFKMISHYDLPYASIALQQKLELCISCLMNYRENP